MWPLKRRKPREPEPKVTVVYNGTDVSEQVAVTLRRLAKQQGYRGY